MRLLWVWVVFVGVAGGVALEEGEGGRRLTLEKIHNSEYETKEERRIEKRRRQACRREEDVELCREGFLFTATALREVRDGGDFAVVLTLERSLHPHVTFDVSLRTLGDRDLKELSRRGDEEETVLAREEVTLGVNELRRVELKVGDLPWRTAYFVVTALPVGHTESGRYKYRKIQKVTSDVGVFVQSDKEEYAPGDTVDFRAVVVDGNVDKTPKFAQVILKPHRSGLEETRLPWVEVPQSGILRGNFTFDRSSKVSVRVTSNVTSSDSSMTTSPRIQDSQSDSSPSQVMSMMSATLEGLSDVSFSQPRVKGRVKLTSPEGIPLEGSCNVTMTHDVYGEDLFANEKAERRVAVGLAGGEFEFDVVRELGAEWKGEEEHAPLYLNAKCIDLHAGSVTKATRTIRFWRARIKLTRWSLGSFRSANSSHTTVVLKFLLGRWDGGEEPSKEVQVQLLLSEENLKRLRPSATNFSLPIPPSGEVRLEFQVDEPPPARWSDTYLLKLGDEEAEVSLEGSPFRDSHKIHVTPVDPARLIRRGDVVRFRVYSCLPYSNVNVILSSRKAIYSSQRFSFSPEREELDKVIELTIPQNVTEGTLNLLVYSRSTHPLDKFKRSDSALVKVNVVPSNGPQYIRIFDQVDVDMSTIVTFRLEGMLPDSVVSLQAAKDERPWNLHDDRNLDCNNPGVESWDYSPGFSDPNDVEISANFIINKPKSSDHRPSLVYVEVDKKTSKEDNGTLTVTKIFDRLTQFGTYVVSGATFNSKSGRTRFSNSHVLKIPPPHVTLGVSVAPSVLLRETVEVLGYVKNNLATPFEGHVTLDSRELGSTEVREEFVKVKPNAFEVLKMNVTPQMVGDLFVSLKSNISSRLTATKKVSVIPFNSKNQIYRRLQGGLK